ncbi:UbiA family prenyltransferase [Actinoplanes sp. NPDC051633]|uniref:UbiA family prenyltransferase n=1 Tax=Actinoplanes sp. NPDC051633 TaxID=3155670 RepID=UPI003431055D
MTTLAPAKAGSTATRTAGRTWTICRPWFWPLGWGGAYLGWVLAGHGLIPPAIDGLLLALLLGPLVWTAVLAQNDLHDLPTDRLNPRKANSPLVTGALTPATLRGLYRGSTAATLVVAAVLGPSFLLGALIVLGLGWAYSAPPLRLKSRPGADVVVNALVVGVLAPLAGWALQRPAGDYPLVMVVLGAMLAAALYLPTTVLDVDADRAAGYRTTAVCWRPERCYRAGLALWTAATALWLAVCELGVLVERTGWTLQWLAAPVVVGAYAILARTPTIPRLAVVAAVFALPAADFLIALIS